MFPNVERMTLHGSTGIGRGSGSEAEGRGADVRAGCGEKTAVSDSDCTETCLLRWTMPSRYTRTDDSSKRPRPTLASQLRAAGFQCLLPMPMVPWVKSGLLISVEPIPM